MRIADSYVGLRLPTVRISGLCFQDEGGLFADPTGTVTQYQALCLKDDKDIGVPRSRPANPGLAAQGGGFGTAALLAG